MENKKSKIKELSECKREIELEIPGEKVKTEFEKIVTRFKNRAKIHGFRPGKAPREIVKQMYYPDIKESLINSLVPEALNEELKGQNLHPVGSPVVDSVTFTEGQPLHFTARFEVWPEFNLPEYKNIRVKKRKTTVTDQDIESSLKEIQAKSAQYNPVEGRGATEGDYVVIEVKSKDRNTNKSFPTEKVVVLAGHPDNEKILNQNLLGIKTLEEKDFVIKYKPDHQNKRLAGKEIEYRIKAISIKEKKIPEINDDFAKDLGEFGSLKELKEKIKEELLASKEKAVERELAEEILKKISDKMTFELPETPVEYETLVLLRQHLAAYPIQKQDKETIGNLKEQLRKKAAQNLRNHLILTEIAKKENLVVSDEEIKEEVKAIAQANNVPLEKFEENVNKEGRREEIKNNLFLKKTVDFLVKDAIIE